MTPRHYRVADWHLDRQGKEVSRLFSRMNDKFHIVGGNAQCTPCPGDETEKTPCTPLKDRTCQPNLFQVFSILWALPLGR